MPIRRRHRASDSPFVERITQVVYDGDAGDVTTPDGCWDIVFRRRRGVLEVLQTGLITRPIPLDYEPGDEYLSISFKPGVIMPWLPGERMVDRAFLRPNRGERAFFLDKDLLEVPTFENAEGMVGRLLRRGWLTRDDVVTRVMEQEPRALSQRSIQRRFRQITGVTSKGLQQILRAQRAADLLASGRAIIDVAHELEFSDQAHLTRSLKRLLGQTPGAIARGAGTLGR